MNVDLVEVVKQLDDAKVDSGKIVALVVNCTEAQVPTLLDKLLTGTRRRINAIGKRVARVTED